MRWEFVVGRIVGEKLDCASAPVITKLRVPNPGKLLYAGFRLAPAKRRAPTSGSRRVFRAERLLTSLRTRRFLARAWRAAPEFRS
jgi:hypothetical protein